MGDAALLTFTQKEGMKLTPEAWLILKAELEKRNIGAGLIRELEHEIILQYSFREKKFEQDVFTDLFITCLDYALAEKEKGTRQYIIYAGLVERGIREEYANYMINKLDEWAGQLRKDSIAKLYLGTGIFFLSLFLIYIALIVQKFELFAELLLFFGLATMTLSWKRKNKYKKILVAILKERNDG